MPIIYYLCGTESEIMKRAAFLLIIALALVGCRAKEQTIFIISTNDMHGAIGKVAQLATMVEAYRSQDTAAVIVVDMGDKWTGNAYVDGATPRGMPMIELMNAVRYDAATFGNHEFDWGQQTLSECIAAANFPIILANIQTGNSVIKQPEPYIIMDIAGTKIAFEGLVTNYVNKHPDGNETSFTGLYFSDPLETAKNAGNLHKQADLVIAMTHIGVEKDFQMAQELPGYFDIILGGHSHSLVDTIINGTVIGQSQNKLKYVGLTTIRLKNRKVISIDYQYLTLDNYAPDAAIAARVEEYENNPELKVKVGSLKETMSRMGEVNLFTDVIRTDLKTEIGLYHIGGVRLEDGIPAGDIQKFMLLNMEPFASRAIKVTMNLGEIKRLILDKFNDTKNEGESHRADIFPSGMRYTVLTNAAGDGVNVKFEGINPDLNKKHTVAIADYIYNNYKFANKPAAEVTSPLLTELFEKFFGAHPGFKPDNAGRINIRQATAAEMPKRIDHRAIRTQHNGQNKGGLRK